MRINRLIVRSAIIACGVILFGLLFGLLRTAIARHHEPVSGAVEQNGWAFVRRYSGEPKPVEKPNAFLEFARRIFGQSEETLDEGPAYPSLHLLMPEEDGRPDGDTTRAGLTAQAVSSTGDHFALGLAGHTDVLGGSSTDGNTYARDVYLHLPAFPPSCSWIDITVADKRGRQATWRVFDLPHLIHQELGPIQAAAQTPVHGITVEARAYWFPGDAPVLPNSWSGPRNDFVPVNVTFRKIDLSPTHNSLQWEIEDSKISQEWERPEDPFVHGLTNFSFADSSGSETATEQRLVGFAAPYPRIQQKVALDMKLAQHKSADETIAFHNLHISRMGQGWSLDPGPNAIVKSPSGITVRVVPTAAREPNARPISTYPITKDHIYYRFVIDQYGNNDALPASPLYQRYHHPIQVNGSLAEPEDMQGMETWSATKENAVEGSIQLKAIPANHVLTDLKFTVTQSTVLQTIPLHFVLPVTQGKPNPMWDRPAPVTKSDTSDCGCAKK